MAVQLKGCPFCNRRANNLVEQEYWMPSTEKSGFAVVCSDLKCSCVGPVRKTRTVAIDAWNVAIRQKKVKGEK